MDPGVAIKMITELFRDGEPEQAVYVAYDLLQWIARGCSPPDGFTADAARNLCRVAIAAGESHLAEMSEKE